MLRIIKDNINGILGTIIFHLLVIAIIMGARLSSVEQRHEQSMLIEFQADISEEAFREIIESLRSDYQQTEQDPAGQRVRNIAVNISEERPVADNFREFSQQELTELDQRVNEILDNAANGILPELDQPEIDFESPKEVFNDSELVNDEPYSGPTTITYDLPGRKHLRMPVPVYKCPDGGMVEVNIAVDQSGRVVNASIDLNPQNFNEACIYQMAMDAAKGSRFSSSPYAPVVQNGTITFYFQKQ